VKLEATDADGTGVVPPSVREPSVAVHGLRIEFVTAQPRGPFPGAPGESVTTLNVDGAAVGDVMHHRYGEPGFHGSMIVDITVAAQHRRRGYALLLLAAVHDLDPGGDLFACEFTRDGADLRVAYEAATGRRYHNWSRS